MYPSIIKENFLSKDEITLIVNQVLELGNHYDDYIENNLHGYYKPWAFYNKKFSVIREILEPKFKDLLDYDFLIDHSHIFDNHTPYGIHTDYFQNRNFPNKLEPAHTFIIPIDNFDSHTLVFNEFSKIKSIKEFIEKEIPPLSINPISAEIRKKYLSHINDDLLDYLSLKEIFPWKQGWLHVTDRKHFHGSDNYPANGVKSKKALIFWTSEKL